MNFADRDQVSFEASKHPSFALGLNFEAISTLQRSHRIQNFRCLLYLRQSLCPSCLKGRMSLQKLHKKEVTYKCYLTLSC